MEQVERYFSGPLTRPERDVLKTRKTAQGDPSSTEAVGRLFDDLRKRRPTKISGCQHNTFSECLLARSGQQIQHRNAPTSAPFRHPRTFIPSRIPQPQKREQSSLESQNEVWGKAYWLHYKQLRGLEAKTYQDAPLGVQRRLIKKALKPSLTLHFPDWNPFPAKGRGKYRVATDLSDSQITQSLVLCMGQVPDVVGGFGPSVTIHGYSDIDFHSLLCIKYDKEMQRRLKPPQEEIVDGSRVVRGFPMDFTTRMKAAERFLIPMTFELFEFLEPHGSISTYRLAVHHFWTGKHVTEENPDRYTLENTYPKPLAHDWANVGCQIKFKNPTEPNYVVRPARHPRIQDSDLETLERRDEPPLPEEYILQAIAYQQKAQKTQAKAIPNAQARPTLARQISDKQVMDKKIADKTKKVRKTSELLGNRRITRRRTGLDNYASSSSGEEDDVQVGNEAALDPGPPPSRSGIAQMVHRAAQTNQIEPQNAPGKVHLQRSKSKVDLPTNRDRSEMLTVLKEQKPPSKIPLPSSSTRSFKDSSSDTIKQQGAVPPLSPLREDTPPSAYLHASSSNEDKGAKDMPGHRASPPLRSILVNQANPANGGAPRADKRSVCWASNIPCPSNDRSIDVSPSRIPAQSLKHPRHANPLADGSANPPPSMAIAIRKIESDRHPGAALSTNPGGHGKSVIIEMTKSLVRDKEMRMAASPYVGNVLDGLNAAEYAKELEREHLMKQRLMELAR